MQPRSQQVNAECSREISPELLAPGISLAQSQPLLALGNEPLEISVYLLFYLSNKIFLNF